ncbi:MFS transporter [Candidatus Peregrinibacteria bacterium]|nr:MFS transporter [Candidatus Peregrinibacteria bacterium]
MKNPLSLPILTKSIHGFIYSMFWVFVPIFLVEQGFSGVEIGLFIGLANLMAVITIFPAGLANDRMHSKRIIFIALLVSIIYYAGLLNTTNTLLLAGAFIFGGLGKNLFNVSVDSLAYRIIDRKQSSRQLGKYLGYVVLIETIGYMLGGSLINHLGFKNTIIVIIVLLIGAMFISRLLPMTHTFKFKLLKYKEDIFRKEVLLFMLVVFLFTLHFGAEKTSYSLFLHTRFNLNLEQTGLFIGTSIIFLALSSLFFGHKVQRGFNPRKVFYIGLFISGIGHALLSLQTNVWLGLVIRCIHEFGDGAMMFSIYYGIVSIFDVDRIGGNASVISLTQIIGASTGAFIFGPVGAQYGYHIPLFASGISTVLAACLLFFIDRKIKRTT